MKQYEFAIVIQERDSNEYLFTLYHQSLSAYRHFIYINTFTSFKINVQYVLCLVKTLLDDLQRKRDIYWKTLILFCQRFPNSPTEAERTENIFLGKIKMHDFPSSIESNQCHRSVLCFLFYLFNLDSNFKAGLFRYYGRIYL